MNGPPEHKNGQVGPLERETLMSAVRTREDFLTGILGSLESLVTVDRDWRLTFANAAALHMARVNEDGLLGKDLRELAENEFPGLELAPLERAMSKRTVTEFESATEGRASVLTFTAYPLSDGGLAVYGRDVTQRRREMDAKGAGDELYRELVESVKSAVLRWDGAGVLTFMNQYAVELFGWRPEEIVGGPVTVLVPTPQPGERDLSHLDQEVLSDPERYVTNVHENVTKDGRRLWLAWTNRALRGEDGEVVEILAIGNDVTELMRAQAALRESEERLQLATKVAGIGAFDWDMQSGVNVWTPELEAMYGLAPGEFGRSQPAWERLVHEDDRSAATALVEETMETGRPVQGEWRVVWRDGSVHWISGRFQALKDQAGKPLRLIGVNTDITELVEAREALLESEKRYRTIVELADEDLTVSSDGTYSFAGSISDDLKPPHGRLRAWFIALPTRAGRHRLIVLFAAIAFELAFLVPMGLVPTTRQVLGLPGSLLALTVVITAVLAGWPIGLAAALAGGVIFWGAVADFGDKSAPVTTVISTGIWVAAALLAGLLTDALREQTRLRKSAAVALAQAETLREQEAERAAHAERARIASDLHDFVTQSLFAATLRTEALAMATGGDSPGITGAAEDVLRLNRGALAQMRTLLLELRGDPVTEVPVQQLLRNVSEAAESRASVKVALSVDEGLALPPPVHEAVYRVTQEALNNTVRHAKAQNAWVQLRAEGGTVRLVIGDDGRGFDPASATQGHFGLAFMRERANATGGELLVTSSAGEGTVVRVDWQTV